VPVVCLPKHMNSSVEKNILISPVIKDIQIWEKNRKYNTLFYQEVTRDGIKL